MSLETAAGVTVASVLALVHTGLVGWVCCTATTAQVDAVWVALSQATPMHWAPTIVSAAGGGGCKRGIVWALLLSAMVTAGVLRVWKIGVKQTPR